MVRETLSETTGGALVPLRNMVPRGWLIGRIFLPFFGLFFLSLPRLPKPLRKILAPGEMPISAGLPFYGEARLLVLGRNRGPEKKVSQSHPTYDA